MGQRQVAAEGVADQQRRLAELAEYVVDVGQRTVSCVLVGVVRHR